ncbi:MAG: M28 family peptidase [Phycisphaeraceae bacterium]|nr:M28 family peptidase [Phycisphaeraceae bacterium]MCB9847426.1 M28 family peptidase [Phycisphaeraceae bacterium]
MTASSGVFARVAVVAALAVPAAVLAEEPLTDAQVLAAPSTMFLSRTHGMLAAEPHVAGTLGDARTIDRIRGLFESYGLKVETQDFDAYLARPVDASLSIVTPDQRDLKLLEPAIAEDPFTAHPDLNPLGWNAYSGSGDVTAQVVFANRGTKEDFQRLKELGVSCEGRIVLARYGGNFRGYKAKYAEEAGAAGLIIFTDPDDNGYNRGAMYPEGGYGTPHQIQRGSIKTLPYAGDPLTPFVEATKGAERLDPEALDLPRIPVQPVGWAAAEPIFARMKGPEAPEEWQGGMDPVYRLTGGEALTVRLKVEQAREIMTTANIIATLEGAEFPQEKVIIGSHHDAWGFGAGDPLSGTIVTIETARALSELAGSGWRPRRSIVFACWGAEEFGIIGSTEWCEAHTPDLMANAVAYINLDAAAMGPEFHAGASPSLQPLLWDLARVVPDTKGRPIEPEGADPIPIGRLGGGSDHVGFLSHLCIPSINLGASGSEGSAYHSNYDTINWYHQIVGGDYEPARMLARMTAMLAVRLADSALIPLDPSGLGADAQGAVVTLEDRARELGVDADFSPLRNSIAMFQGRAREVMEQLRRESAAGTLGPESLRSTNALLLAIDRAWLAPSGLPDRPWHRNLYAAPDETSGYAAWALPGIRHAIEARDPDGVIREQARCVRALGVMTQMLDAIDAAASVPQ